MPVSQIKQWEALVAGAFGAFVASLSQGNSQGGRAISSSLAGYLGDGTPEYVVLLILPVIGAFACWIYSPTNRPDAFFRGLAVFGVLNIIPPSHGGENHSQPKDGKPARDDMEMLDQPADAVDVSDASFSSEPMLYASLGGYFDVQQTADNCPSDVGPFKPNARVLANDWVSGEKPSTRFMNGKIYVQKCGEGLAKGQSVELTGRDFETFFYGHYYVELRYQAADGQLRKGWVWAGRKPNYWQAIKRGLKNIE